mmetsp:Transcript_21913/g.60929  ORF Transcript_21913/g.60929 Transcript_21913/m.60929 type:complete len:436 (+) Transcript_21913:138-1445(+)
MRTDMPRGLLPKRNHAVVFVMMVLVLLLSWGSPVASFRSSIVKLAPKGQRTSFLARPVHQTSATSSRRQRRSSRTSSATGLSMFMGSDGGILGVGTPEVFTVLLVGYFVLGPSDLYKLVKEIGKFIQNIRTLGNDLTTSFESNMESQLQLEEIRKAQQELNDAFSFRRTINTNKEEEAFSTNVQTTRPGEEAPGMGGAAVAGAAPATTVEEGPNPPPKKKIRRRVKKRAAVENPPELEMPNTAAATTTAPTATASDAASEAAAASQMKKPSADPFVQDSAKSFTPEEEALINAEFDKYTSLNDFAESTSGPSWYDDISEPATAGSSIQQPTTAETSRFQQQLSGNWNDQILDKSEELAPLAKVMDMLALLEEEKIASQKRLEEEFRERAKSDESFYRRQRQLLEEAAAEVQSNAYNLNSTVKTDNNTTVSAASTS